MADNFLGLDLKVVVAGCAGGLSTVYATLKKKPEAWEQMTGLIVGGLTANYVAPVVASVLGFPSTYILVTAFFVGGAGKWICIEGLKRVKGLVVSRGQ